MGIDSAIVEILELVIKSVGVENLLSILFARTGQQRAQEILDAAYSAADAVADKAEADKLSQ